MTVKRRLFWSNILMIAVPVVSAAPTGMVCIGFIWLSLTGGAGLGITTQEDFDHACMAISEVLEYEMERNSDYASVKVILDSNQMALRIESDGKMIFEYGIRKRLTKRCRRPQGC